MLVAMVLFLVLEVAMGLLVWQEMGQKRLLLGIKLLLLLGGKRPRCVIAAAVSSPLMRHDDYDESDERYSRWREDASLFLLHSAEEELKNLE